MREDECRKDKEIQSEPQEKIKLFLWMAHRYIHIW